jgi:hypothetical protein
MDSQQSAGIFVRLYFCIIIVIFQPQVVVIPEGVVLYVLLFGHNYFIIIFLPAIISEYNKKNLFTEILTKVILSFRRGCKRTSFLYKNTQFLLVLLSYGQFSYLQSTLLQRRLAPSIAHALRHCETRTHIWGRKDKVLPAIMKNCALTGLPRGVRTVGTGFKPALFCTPPAPASVPSFRPTRTRDERAERRTGAERSEAELNLPANSRRRTLCKKNEEKFCMLKIFYTFADELFTKLCEKTVVT